MKLGLYGGGFKPFHTGHFAKLLLALDEADKVTAESGYDYLIHGHLHVPPHRDGLKINVAADLIDFTPVSREYILESLGTSTSNSSNEIINLESDDEKIKLSIEIRPEDFSGTIDHIYKLLREQWRSK